MQVDRDATLHEAGANGTLQSITIEGNDPYTVVASIPRVVDEPGGLTVNRLRAAGTNYPAGIASRYLTIPDGAMGPEAKKVLADIMARVTASGRTTPYDVAAAMVDEFHTSRYVYRTNVLGVCADTPSIVECFAAHKTGYCEHYASTMVILLRAQKIPARLVEGFLPGDIDPATGQRADPDRRRPCLGRGLLPGDRLASLRSHRRLPLADPKPARGHVRARRHAGTQHFVPAGQPQSRRARDSQRGSRPRGIAGRNTGSNGPVLIVVAAVLIAAVMLLAFLAWRRGPRSASTPEGVYASITALARRLGFGPRPTETAYEYATALGDILPRVRPELQTVAAAKVEVAYGRRELGDDRLQALRASYRRLRVGLLRLAFRRRERRRRR